MRQSLIISKSINVLYYTKYLNFPSCHTKRYFYCSLQIKAIYNVDCTKAQHVKLIMNFHVVTKPIMITSLEIIKGWTKSGARSNKEASELLGQGICVLYMAERRENSQRRY